MANLLIVDDTSDWPAEPVGFAIVRASDYLTDSAYVTMRGARIFNLCRSYRYQSTGYYVSLLARARGHKPLPGVTTIQDLKTRSVGYLITEELDGIMQKSLAPVKENAFHLSIYFGKQLAQRHQRLATQLFNLFPAPLLRAEFQRKHREWHLRSVRAISLGDVAENHLEFVRAAAIERFSRFGSKTRHKSRGRYDMAILVDEKEPLPPSDPLAVRKFLRAAKYVGFNAELIDRNDYGRIAEFDALFIRETTRVNHHTYRCARRAAQEGLEVIDDPGSIIRCSNKVFLAESLERKRLPRPKALIVHRQNVATIPDTVGLPCVLKEPDSSFSQGVTRANDTAELAAAVQQMLARSDLIVAQEFLPTDYDWRVCVLAGKPLFVCRYYMVKRHWQIYRRDARGRVSSGDFDTLAVEDAPARVVRLGLKAAGIMGNGFYGVDIKQRGKRLYVIEINDNPSVDSGVEDKVLGKALYRHIMQLMFDRVDRRKQGERRRD